MDLSGRKLGEQWVVMIHDLRLANRILGEAKHKCKDLPRSVTLSAVRARIEDFARDPCLFQITFPRTQKRSILLM